MIRWLKKYIAKIKSSTSLKLNFLRPYLKKFPLWESDCQSVARGVAAGLAGATIPGFQIFYAALLALLLRGNLPIALVCTFVTNPVTAIPITYFIYLIGSLFTENGKSAPTPSNLEWDFSSLHVFWSNISSWAAQFGKAYFIGLPIVSACLGIIGYFGTILIWKIGTFLFHKKRK